MKKLYFLLFTLLISAVSFGQIIISEIADPNNDFNARYVELFNAGPNAVDFTEGSGWQIDKYTNASATVSLSLDLTGTIPAGGFYIIAYDIAPGTFNTVYGSIMSPNIVIQLDAVSNGVAGGNGDDSLLLLDGNDMVVDAFGSPGTDGTGTCAEFEDGRAERKISITTPNPTFDESEWNIWADSAVMGCTSHVNLTRSAPDDFDPGQRGAPTCPLSLTNPSSACDAITNGVDTYTATIDFVGGGTTTYTVSSDTGSVDLSGGDPSTDATGTITVTGISEGTDVVINVTDGGLCDVDFTVFSPSCEPTLTLPISQDFDFANGSSLIDAPNWNNFSGTSGDLLISSGQVLVQHGTPSEDASIAFTPVSGDIFYALDFTVIDPAQVISGGDFEYFALLKDDAFGFGARLDIVEASSGGDFTVGIASDEGTADATWPTDLSFGVTYRATVRYNQDSNIAELWIDANTSADTSILAEDRPDPGITISQFALRQSDSSINEGILVDNLIVAQTFTQTLSVNDPRLINTFSLYPNPTSTGEVTISTVNSGAVSIMVYDILGKQVKNEALPSNGRLNVSSLKSGVYIMRITQDNATVTKKLVIR